MKTIEINCSDEFYKLILADLETYEDIIHLEISSYEISNYLIKSGLTEKLKPYDWVAGLASLRIIERSIEMVNNKIQNHSVIELLDDEYSVFIKGVMKGIENSMKRLEGFKLGGYDWCKKQSLIEADELQQRIEFYERLDGKTYDPNIKVSIL